MASMIVALPECFQAAGDPIRPSGKRGEGAFFSSGLCVWNLCCVGSMPFGFQNRIDEFVSPLPIETIVLDKMCFPAHFQPFDNPDGAMIERV